METRDFVLFPSLLLNIVLGTVILSKTPPMMTGQDAVDSAIAFSSKQKNYLLKQARFEEYEYWDSIYQQHVKRRMGLVEKGDAK